ncbi:MAG: ferritin-like domain-containing protein, partial [Myxococcales bacterium]|nr:ferritin-like domain-containing protein [Myxococcales bacterium]
EVRAFLGTIDTPSEAGLLVHLSGYHVDCDGNNFTQTGDGYIVYAQSGTTCGGDVSGHKLLVGPDGTIQELESEIVEHGDDNCQIGRIPTGLERSAKPERDGLGAFFAEVAHLEAASVAAFEDLAAELEHHGAPEALIRQARAAAREETRHAILTGALARRYGGERRIPRVQRQAPRDLEAIALDNAVEGLGRETFGALIGHHQALHATDPTIRSVMQTIALDETRHAELSHALHEWLCSQLSSAARDRVEHARRQALLRFRAGFCQEPSPELQRLAGLPSGAEATRMFDALFGGPV